MPVQTIPTREGTVADIPEIARHRRRMCEDMNYTDDHALSTMVSLTADYLKKAIPEGSFRSWLACDDGRIVAGGAVVISPWPSHAYDLDCRRAMILNISTEPKIPPARNSAPDHGSHHCMVQGGRLRPGQPARQ